jgi:hypothetical protein
MSVDLKKMFSKSNAKLWAFFGLALLVAALLAVFISPYASKSPDGLDKFAESHKEAAGFQKAEKYKPVYKGAPLSEYAVPAVKNEKVSTGLSGLIGVIVTLVAGTGLALVIALTSRRKKKSSPDAS